MNRTEYRAMAEMAIEKFQYLTAFLPNDVEVVYVVSDEVYGAMLEYEEYNPGARITPYTTAGIYYGARVARINEEVAEPVFTPVVYSRGFQHYDAVQVNDYVIFNDEDNDLLFRLVRRTPDAMYTDTGLTVSFGEGNVDAIDNILDNAVANTADNATTIGDAIEGIGRTVEMEMERTFADLAETAAFETIQAEPETAANVYVHDMAAIPNIPYGINVRTLEELEEAIREMSITADLTAEQVIRPNQLADGTITLNLDGAQINVDLLQELAGEVSTPRRAKKRASKEKELNPGDTKLLDEYLHSFMKGGC